MIQKILLVFVTVALPMLALAQAPWDPVATFSILGDDPATGEVGGAVQSRVFSVGNGVLWAEAGLGVVATQAIVDVTKIVKDAPAPAEPVMQVRIHRSGIG